MAELPIPMSFLRTTLRSVAATGVDVGEALRRAGLPVSTDPDTHLSPRTAATLLRQLWVLSGDDLLGLGDATAPRGTLQLVAHALVGPGHVGEALGRMAAFRDAVPGLPRVRLEEGPERATVRIEMTGLRDPEHLVLDASLVVLQRFLSWLIGQPLRFEQVELPYPAPANAREYQQVFGCPITFGRPGVAATFSAAVLAAPMIRSTAELEVYLRRAPEDLLTRREYGSLPSSRVRAALESGLFADRWPDADDIAAALTMSTGHLRRTLRGEGTSLIEIKEEILRATAITALAGGATISEIAGRLGFSEASAFRRAFKRWTGSTPTAYRFDVEP